METLSLTADALNTRGFTAKTFKTMAEAKQAILDLIDIDESVATGGSVTLTDSGILSSLGERGNDLYSIELNPVKTWEERIEVRKHGLMADWFLSSTNAITTSGELYNIDGSGNRIAALVFGPPKNIVLVGKNKIVQDANLAIDRIKNDACGKNARRLGLKTPCAVIDQCQDCRGQSRMCRAEMKIQYPPLSKEAFYVFLVNEDWGY